MPYGILIAEDELIERMVLKKTLVKQYGDCCEIYGAANGKEALEIFRKQSVQIAILDIEMPGIKGIDVAEIIRQESEGCCIIFLTAYDRFEYAKRAIRLRAMEYLLKPYSEKELLSVVEEALRWADKTARAENFPDSPELQTEEPEEYFLAEEQSRLSVMVSMVEEYLRENYWKDISMQDAARAVHYSDAYFSKMFKQQYGVNFTAYLTDFRIEEAKKLLRRPDINIKEIGGRVGYEDPTYFARVFRRVTGQSPTEYRMSQIQ